MENCYFFLSLIAAGLGQTNIIIDPPSYTAGLNSNNVTFFCKVAIPDLGFLGQLSQKSDENPRMRMIPHSKLGTYKPGMENGKWVNGRILINASSFNNCQRKVFIFALW